MKEITNKNQRRSIKEKIMLNLELPSFPISLDLSFLISPGWDLLSFYPQMQHHSHQTECSSLHFLPAAPWKWIPPGESAVSVMMLPVSPWIVFSTLQVLHPVPPALAFSPHTDHKSWASEWAPSLCSHSETLLTIFAHTRTDLLLWVVSLRVCILDWWLGPGSLWAVCVRCRLSLGTALVESHVFSPIGIIPASWTISLLFLYSILVEHQLFETHYCPKVKSMIEIFISENYQSRHISSSFKPSKVFFYSNLKLHFEQNLNCLPHHSKINIIWPVPASVLKHTKLNPAWGLSYSVLACFFPSDPSDLDLSFHASFVLNFTSREKSSRPTQFNQPSFSLPGSLSTFCFFAFLAVNAL